MFFTKSKIFLYFCLGFSLGIFIASFVKVPVLALIAGAVISIAIISIFWRKKRAVVAGFFVIFAISGIYRYQSAASISQDIDGGMNNKNTIIRGIVSEEPDVRIKDTRYVIAIEKGVNAEDKNAWKVLATLPHYPVYQYGDMIELEGKITVPEKFDTFDYQSYLAKDGIFFTMYSPRTALLSSGNGNFIYGKIFVLKNKFKEKLMKILPEPQSALLRGLLLGERSGLEEKLKADFATTGTSHIVAVSGFNVTIIAVLILGLFLAIGFSRDQAFWISLAAIILFIIMVGSPASAIRAGIMGILLLVATRSGRLSAAANAVSFAATLMLFINPMILRFDVGFQLSFLAVIGIVWLYPIIERFFSGKKNMESGQKESTIILEVKSAFLMTVSAQIMALPVLLGNFGNLSLIAPIANILVLPFVPLAMAAGFLAGATGFIWPGLAKIIGYFAWAVLTYQIRIIEYLASLPWASVSLDIGTAGIVVYYLVVGTVIFRNKNIKIKA